MPSKKNTTPNAFYFFMQSLRPQLQGQGVVLENGNRTLAEIAGPRWAELSAEEREPFNQMAKERKSKKKMGLVSDDDKMDCTRQFISKRVDTVALNEQRRKRERKLIIDSLTGRDVCSTSFYFIGFMSLCDLPHNKFMPCEMAVVEYSLKDGIKRQFHKFVDPGTIPMGYRFEATRQSESTHKIPCAGLSTESYPDIYKQFLEFVNPQKEAEFPVMFCKSAETKLVEFSLQWLANQAGRTNKLNKVFELEALVCQLHAESTDAEVRDSPSLSQVTELLSSTVFDYEVGTRCQWHEENESRHCAKATVVRCCYCLSDFLCAAFDIEMTSQHLPERPENTSSVLITSRPPNKNLSKASNDDNTRGFHDEPSAIGVKKRQYARRGPTYDEESLKVGSEAEIPAMSDTVPIIPSIVRGRGRGRATIPCQPLRRPNLPGVAASVGKSSGVAVGSSKAPSKPAQDNTREKENKTEQTTGSLGAGRGRGGLMYPKIAPKMWAGGPSAPHPSVAPLPPSSWHINSNPVPLNPYGYTASNVPYTWASFDNDNNYGMDIFNYPGYNQEYPSIENQYISNMQDTFQGFGISNE